MTSLIFGAEFEPKASGVLPLTVVLRNEFRLPSSPAQSLGSQFAAPTPLQKLGAA